MLDIEIITPPTADVLDVVSIEAFRRHLRMTPSNQFPSATLEEALTEALDDLHGIGGELNRTILATSYCRYLTKFPGLDQNNKPLPIQLPYGPLLDQPTIAYGGDSPTASLSSSDFVVKSGMLVPEIHPVSSWPTVTEAPRAVSITYTAGYNSGGYPPKLQRMVKILAAHYLENTEATINEPRQMQINRKVEYALDQLKNLFRIPLAHDDWNE